MAEGELSVLQGEVHEHSCGSAKFQLALLNKNTTIKILT
jgi:hypothetical protein